MHLAGTNVRLYARNQQSNVNVLRRTIELGLVSRRENEIDAGFGPVEGNRQLVSRQLPIEEHRIAADLQGPPEDCVLEAVAVVAEVPCDGLIHLRSH